MGIYDRAYLHDDEERTRSWGGGRSLVVNLIIVNVVLWVADALFEGQIRDHLSLQSDLVQKPWLCWQLLSYGFVHAPEIGHILFNMFALWFFGTEIESVYGRAEFLRIYLVAIAFAGLAWVLMTMVNREQAVLMGASGGIMAIVILYVLHFPRRLIYIWGILPVPAWALGTLYVVVDMLGALNPGGSNVANVAHLGGVVFGFVYWRTGMNLGRFIPRRLSDLKLPSFRPRLRVHDPGKEPPDLSQQVDSILEKISREGESSLTKQERRTLEEASRRYQRRKQ
jgi:membrane associated rhomboid family serine protease